MKEDTVKRQVLGQGPKKDGSGFKARGEEGSRMGERERRNQKGSCLEETVANARSSRHLSWPQNLHWA